MRSHHRDCVLREEEFLRRESTLKDHINKLQRDKDQVESKISTLEVQVKSSAFN